MDIDQFFYTNEDKRENLEFNLNDIYSTSKDVSIVNILNTIGENNTTSNVDEKDQKMKNRENSDSKSPDIPQIKNKNTSAINASVNNNNFSLGNNSQNNFNVQKKKEINTPKNLHSNRMLLIDSSKEIKSIQNILLFISYR